MYRAPTARRVSVLRDLKGIRPSLKFLIFQYIYMYILIIYLDINKKYIRSIILFDKIKDIIEYTDGLIKYNDIGKKQQKYRTYKSFFEVIHVNGFNSGKYFR